MADINNPLVEKILDIAQQYNELDEIHRSQSDDLSARFEMRNAERLVIRRSNAHTPLRSKAFPQPTTGTKTHISN